MKTALVVICAIVGVFAEPPRYRPARFRFQRIELAPTTTESSTEPTTESAPYPASGWRPDEPFTLPNEQTAPSDSYGPPEPQKSGPYPPSGWKPDQPFTLPQQPPATSYGIPDSTYGAPRDATTTDSPQAEKQEGSVQIQKSLGEYYVLLPNGLLQKVEVSTENDVQNMKYTAHLQLRDPAPLFVVRS